MDKLKLHSPNISESNIVKIRKLFPGCVSEVVNENGVMQFAVNFEQLRQELSDHIVEGGQERYHLDWPGKRQALVTSNAPIAKTFRPAREESLNFDTTQNLFIEGDNLDALKLLQETYLGRVKMIYIDPPYNTGNDFVYRDNLFLNTQEFLKRSNQKDESGNQLVANLESNGRFHSDWLNMIYPRIRLSRNLLSDDGVIVSSIDENEVTNLRRIFDEVFGEENFLFQITLLCNPKGRSQDKYVANCHEYIVGYSKRSLPKGAINLPKHAEEISANYRLKDKRGFYRELELRNTHREFGKHNRRNLYYPFYVNTDGRVLLEPQLGFEPVYPDWSDGFNGCWTWGIGKAQQQIDEIVTRKVKGAWKIYRKNYAEDKGGKATKQVKSIWIDKQFHTEKGQSTFNRLFETKSKIFQSPKSVETLKQLILMCSTKDSIIMDFFAGSGTTGHAVLEQNSCDCGDRRFILIQLDENSPTNSEARKAGYSSITDIAKERIRRAGKKILNGHYHNDWNKDVGFRVLKIDTSNMQDVYYQPHEVDQTDLIDAIDNIKPERTAEDLLFQVLLDWGVDLTLPIRCRTIQGKRTFFVDKNALVACFDIGVNEEFVKKIAKYKPKRVIFRDNGFISDAMKINVEQIFRQISPFTEVKSI